MNNIADIAEIRFPTVEDVYADNQRLVRVILDPQGTYKRARVQDGWIILSYQPKAGPVRDLLIPAVRASAIEPRLPPKVAPVAETEENAEDAADRAPREAAKRK